MHVVVGEQTLGDESDAVHGLPDGHDDDHDGGDDTPRERHGDPEVEVVLAEHAALHRGVAAPGGERQQGPDDDHNDAEADTPLGDEPERVLEHFGVVLAGVQVGHGVVDQGDLGSHGGEVEVLGVRDGHRGADGAGRENRHDVTGEHGVVRAEGVNGHGEGRPGGLGVSGDADPGDHGEELASERTRDGAVGGGFVPREEERNRHHRRADEDTHHQVHETQG